MLMVGMLLDMYSGNVGDCDVLAAFWTYEGSQGV
jgi:hypothetical protein